MSTLDYGGQLGNMLGPACDRMNAALERAQRQLRARFPGRGSTIPLGDALHLSYWKWPPGPAGQWTLIVTFRDRAHSQPLDQCTWKVRLMACDAIPSLFAALTQDHAELAADIVDAAERLDSYLHTGEP